MDNFSYLIPKFGAMVDSNTEDLLSVHLEISCPSAGSALSAYLESGVSINMLDVPAQNRVGRELFLATRHAVGRTSGRRPRACPGPALLVAHRAMDSGVNAASPSPAFEIVDLYHACQHVSVPSLVQRQAP